LALHLHILTIAYTLRYHPHCRPPRHPSSIDLPRVVHVPSFLLNLRKCEFIDHKLDLTFSKTTALQRSGLLDEVDLRWEHGEGLVGSRLVTVFAPLNHAFDRLPERLRFYLFSPFGKHALRKLLEYHIAPDSLVLSGKSITSYVWYSGDN